MLEVALHTGTEHPGLLFAAVPSFLTFVVGLVLGARTGIVQRLLRTGETESPN